jgi:hypothetical protein
MLFGEHSKGLIMSFAARLFALVSMALRSIIILRISMPRPLKSYQDTMAEALAV